MIRKSALSSAGGVVCLALSAIGCSAEVGVGDGAEQQDAGFEFAPVASEPNTAKVVPGDSLSPKGSVNRHYGEAVVRQLTIPNGGTVDCYTTSLTEGMDPVLVLFRRHDNQHKDTPSTEQVWVQTLTINDDIAPPARDAHIWFNNTSGGTLKAYLMGFAYGDSLGIANLTCAGSPTEQILVFAGSVKTWGGSGYASTSVLDVAGDPWLYLFDENPLSYWGNWNNDSNEFESGFSYSGPNRWLWFVARGKGNSGDVTINY